MMGRRGGRDVLAALVIVVLAGAIASRAEPVAAAGANCVPVGDRVTVAIVIDDGRSSPRVYCVAVPSGATGADAIKDRHPRYDGSGLLCAIDGYPTSGCGDPAGGGAYSYWSYWWKDGNDWSYATTGPATRRLTADGMVEGWHFVTGVDDGAGNAPRLAPTSVTFGAAPPPTEPSSTTPPAQQPTGTTPSAGSPSGGAPTAGRANSPTGSTSPPSTVITSAAGGPDTTTTTMAAATPGTAPVSLDAANAAATDPTAGAVEVAGESVGRAEPLAMTSGSGDSNHDAGGRGGLVGAALVGVALVGAVGSVVIRRRRTSR